MSKRKHVRTISRLVLITLPDGTLDRARKTFVVLPNGREIPVDDFERTAERDRFRTMTPKKRRRKPRKGLGSAVVGMVTL